jgi:hypothetical protein
MNVSGKSLSSHASDADLATLKSQLHARGGSRLLRERFLDMMEDV